MEEAIMGKVHNRKLWACLLVIAMITSTFVGFSTIVWGTNNSPDGLMKTIPNIEFVELNGRQPVNENILNMNSRYQKDIESLNPSPGPEPLGIFNYNFDTDTAGQLPADPPWSYVDTPAGQASAFGPDDFEDDILGEKPDSPPWTSTDGLSATYYWMEDFEGFTPGQDLSTGQISGSLGFFAAFDPAATLQAEAPPAGAPPSIIPGIDTGSMAAHFVDGGAGSYWGPAGIEGPSTDQGYCGGWVYMTAVARFDLGIIDMGLMAVTAEVAFQNDNNIYHWPGGVYTQILGITWTVDTWHELFIQYDDPSNTYSVWFDGVQYVPGSAFTAGSTDTDAMVWFGDGVCDVYVDNFCHMWPPTGLTDICQVVDTQAHSGAQSIFLDQNNEAAPEMVRMVNGAVATILDQSDMPAIEIRANAGNFEYSDGGAWQIAQAFAADTWYQFTIDFDTMAKTYNLAIDTIPIGTGAFAGETGTLTGVRYAGTGGTQSEHYIDDVDVSCAGAAANITVSNMVSNSAPNALRFQEYNAGGPGFIGADNLGAGLGGIGNYSFWFYSTDNWGGQTWTLADMNGGATMTAIGLGQNLASLAGDPGEVDFVDNDGTGNWVVNGPSYNPNEWHRIGIDYDCLDTSHSGSTGTYWYTWDGGPQQGPYGMIGAAQYLDFLVCDGGATDTFGDFFYDDFSMSLNAMPGPPTNCWAEVPPPTGVEVFGNYSTDQDNPIEGVVTNTEVETHTVDGATEDVREVTFGDVPIWANYTPDQDNPDHGVVVNDYTNIDEVSPPDGATEEIIEIIPGGSTWISYSTDQDNPWNGTVIGTEVNTHTIDAITQDITEIQNGGNIWLNYSANSDIPVQGTVTGTFLDTQILDGVEQEILEVNSSKKSTLLPGPGPQPGAQVYYNNRALFDAAAGPLPIEDFEAITAAPGSITGMTGPIDENTNNGPVTPGMILPGIRLLEDPPRGANAMVAIGAGWGGAPTKTVATNFFIDNMRITFDDPAYPVQCIGLDLQSYFGATTPTIEIYGVGGVLLDTTTAPSDNTGIFWGVISDEQIEYIIIIDPAQTDGGDNIAFGEGAWGNSLEHQWEIDPMRPNATALQLIVNARTNAGPRDDNFTFEYSEDGTMWNSTGIVVNSSVMTQYVGNVQMLNTTSAPIWIRVKDDYNDDYVQNDTIFIDEIRVQYYNDQPFWYTLEHRWRTEPILAGADNISLYVTAATNVGSDDGFRFEYATALAGPYTQTTLIVNSDIMTTYSVEIPASLSGQIYIRVMDTNMLADPTQADTVFIDEIRVERQVGMSLEHRWRTQAIDTDSLILEVFINARTNTGSDDTFTFGYSATLAGPYTPMITVNSDVMTTYNTLIPVLTGVIYVNVIDDNTVDTALQDTIIIDTLTIEASISSATVTRQVATGDIPDHGTVTGTFALTGWSSTGDRRDQSLKKLVITSTYAYGRYSTINCKSYRLQ
jgi:hypothetical protein